MREIDPAAVRAYVTFGYVPTPALVAPIEFTLRATDYAVLGGYASRAVTLEDVVRAHKVRLE